MDPEERALLEKYQTLRREGARQASQATLRIQTAYRKLHDVATGLKHSPAQSVELRPVNQTKSSSIAAFARKHPFAGIAAPVGVVVAALVFVVRQLWKRFAR